MEHIYIFDYSNKAIYHGEISEDEDVEDYYAKHDLKESDCYNMIVENEIEIENI